jgi:hypothetical protein
MCSGNDNDPVCHGHHGPIGHERRGNTETESTNEVNQIGQGRPTTRTRPVDLEALHFTLTQNMVGGALHTSIRSMRHDQ